MSGDEIGAILDESVEVVRARIKDESLDRFTSDYLADDARDWLAGFAARAAIEAIREQLVPLGADA